MEKILFTSESVTEGHPDKICDAISDAILDALIEKDPMSRVACETSITTGLVLVMGEITTQAYIDIPQIVRETLRNIGYTRGKYGFDADTCGVITCIDEQSKDIAQGVNEALEVKGLKRKLTLDNIKTVTCFISAIKRAKEIIKDFDPDIVIGCGGYVTAPVIYAAKKLGKRTFIHEQNSVVGLANKFLSRYTDKVGVSFESTIKDFPKDKAILTGNPCSEKALSIKATTKDKLGVDKDKKLVLIVMGSLGSRSVNDRIFSFVDKFRNKNYSVIIVTGNSYYERVKERRVPDNVKVVPFIYEMPSVMKITDLMVTRAGASTMSEITALGVPAIFIPSPYVANNHQYKNAKDLVDQNAGIMLEEKDMTDRSLIELIDKTLNDKDKIKDIKDNLKKIGIKDSSTRIYNILKDLIISCF